MLSPTVILWDIDETLNFQGTSRWPGDLTVSSVSRIDSPSLFEKVPESIKHFDLRVSDDLMKAITELDKISHIENKWITTWGSHARTVFSNRVGLDCGQHWSELLESEVKDSDSPSVWWKTLAVRSFLNENPDSRVIWIDDLLDHTVEIETDNQKLADDFPDRVALIGVPPHCGVTPDIFAFVKRLATDAWKSGVFIFEG